MRVARTTQLQIARRLSTKTYSRRFYEDHFNGRAYAEKYLSPNADYQLKAFPEDFLHRMFYQGNIRGKDLLDVGSGPTVRSVVSASARIKDIYLSDLVEGNRKEIKKWLRDDKDAVDCSWLFRLVAGFEGVSDCSIVKERVRKSVKGVFQCDIIEEHPLHPKLEPRQFDVVTSCECLDTLTDQDSYFRAVKNVTSLIRKGGSLALVSSLGCSRYRVGDVGFPAAKMNPGIARRAFQEAGLFVVVMEERYYESDFGMDSDSIGMFAALCRKL